MTTENLENLCSCPLSLAELLLNPAIRRKPSFLFALRVAMRFRPELRSLQRELVFFLSDLLELRLACKQGLDKILFSIFMVHVRKRCATKRLLRPPVLAKRKSLDDNFDSRW